MKKVLCVFAVFVLLLCGCKPKGTTRVNFKDMTFDFTVQRGEEKTVFAVKTEDGTKKITATVLKPKNIKGILFERKDSDISVSFDGIGYSIPLDKTQNGDVFALLNDVVLLSDGKEARQENGNFKFKGKTKSGSFELFVTPDGLPLSLITENSEKTYNFGNLTLVK